MSKRTLILGLAQGYSRENLLPFVASLRSTGYQGDLCLFYRHLAPATIDWLDNQGIFLEPFSVPSIPFPGKEAPISTILRRLHASRIGSRGGFHNIVRFVVNAGGVAPGLQSPRLALMRAVLQPVNLRYLLYYSYLQDHAHRYDAVMLTDVRDVLFQLDPFSFPMGDHLYLSGEEPSVRLSSCPFNRTWILNSFGPKALHRVGNFPIICSGTTIGSTRQVVRYLERMVEGFTCRPLADDQALHNLLYYIGRLDRAVVLPNYAGPILTLHYAPDDRIIQDDEGQFLNSDGTIVNVVHQYDRLLSRGQFALRNIGNTYRLLPKSGQTEVVS